MERPQLALIMSRGVATFRLCPDPYRQRHQLPHVPNATSATNPSGRVNPEAQPPAPPLPLGRGFYSCSWGLSSLCLDVWQEPCFPLTRCQEQPLTHPV